MLNIYINIIYINKYYIYIFIVIQQGFKGFHNRARLGLACTYAYINSLYSFKYANKTHIPDISKNCSYQLCLFVYVYVSFT